MSDLTIRPVFSPKEDMLILQLNAPLILRGHFQYSDPEACSESPLAQALFKIPGIASISFKDDQVHIALKSLDDWTHAPTQAMETIVSHLKSGLPVVTEAAYDRLPPERGPSTGHP